MAWTVDWRVTIDGRDVSSAMRPYLMDITVSDKDGSASDTCQLRFDDKNGQCLLPTERSQVVVHLDGVQVFQGTVDSTPWELSRGGGRILSVSAKGVDLRGKAKEGQRWHLDDETLEEALSKAGSAAGIDEVIVDPAFASITRDYWSPGGASFIAWGGRLARELGATFKIRGNRAVFAKRGTGNSAAGGAMPSIEAKVGFNVITASIDPLRSRRRFKKARTRHFNRKKARFEEKDIEFDTDDDVDAVNVRRDTVADADEAEHVGRGRKSDSEREAGVGSIEMDIAPEAQAEGTLVLTGARPGIDGTYRITGVTHKASRGGGATTTCDLAQPSKGAGKDSRIPVPTPAPR